MNDAALFGERIRRMVETTVIHWGEHQLSVKVSIGVATWPIVRASLPDELINAADKAMYQAKNAGRNQIAINRGDAIVPISQLEMEWNISDQHQ
jgi:diguanylate cyclase (GGDEF)-like protein